MVKKVDMELMCSFHEEEDANATIKSTHELVKGMSRLVEGRAGLERKANLYRKEYTNQKFELCLGGFVSTSKLKDEEVWLGELGRILSQ